MDERLDDERARIGEPAALIARSRGNDAENVAVPIEDGAAARFFDVDVLEFEKNAVLRPRRDRARKEHARLLAYDPDQLVILHVARNRHVVVPFDDRTRARRKARRMQAAAVEAKQGEIAGARARDVGGDVVLIAADIDANAGSTRDDVRRCQDERTVVVRIDDDPGAVSWSGAWYDRTPTPLLATGEWSRNRPRRVTAARAALAASTSAATGAKPKHLRTQVNPRGVAGAV